MTSSYSRHSTNSLPHSEEARCRAIRWRHSDAYLGWKTPSHMVVTSTRLRSDTMKLRHWGFHIYRSVSPDARHQTVVRRPYRRIRRAFFRAAPLLRVMSYVGVARADRRPVQRTGLGPAFGGYARRRCGRTAGPTLARSRLSWRAPYAAEAEVHTEGADE